MQFLLLSFYYYSFRTISLIPKLFTIIYKFFPFFFLILSLLIFVFNFFYVFFFNSTRKRNFWYSFVFMFLNSLKNSCFLMKFLLLYKLSFDFFKTNIYKNYIILITIFVDVISQTVFNIIDLNYVCVAHYLFE